ncbi:MAG: ribose 5-phosphate isomerase B [Oscillospiraceae bacterium]|nr:ribose 5-phosphate isomerase B [Oscillospiraceae bacterium]
MLAIGSDHGGFYLKQAVMKHLEKRGIEVKDFGTYTPESCDYSDYAKPVAKAILDGKCDRGILICGTGIGISITANRFPGIRAANCTDCFMAEATRQHNDANILALGARVVGEGLALKIVDTFLDTPFSNDERHVRRIKKIEN